MQRHSAKRNSVKRNSVLFTLAAVGLSLGATSAQAQAPDYSTASYRILAPQISGNTSIVSGSDLAAVRRAMVNDSAGAIKRRFAGAKIVQESAPNVIEVTPTMTAPNALVPWAKFSAGMVMRLPSGETKTFSQTFGVLEVYNHRADAANYMYDQVAKQLP